MMKTMRDSGMIYKKISESLGLAQSTVIYHLDPGYKKKAIKRMMEYQGERGDRKDYMKKYMSNRYNNDEEFRDRVRANSLRSYHKRKNNERK